MRGRRHISDIATDEVRRTLRRQRRRRSGCAVPLLIVTIVLGLLAFAVFEFAFDREVDRVVEVYEEQRKKLFPESEDQPEGPRNIWPGEEPFICGGNSVMNLRDVRGDLPDQTAIIAEDNCELTLVDVEVSAGTALLVRGNARVTIEGGSHLEGTQHAILLEGNSSATSYGATLVGPIDVHANADFTNID